MSAWEHLQVAVEQELGPESLHNGWSQQNAAARDTPAASGELPEQAVKLAAIREKNRLAQQRFRERQREKQRQVEQECDELQGHIEQTAAENERLQLQSVVYTKVLAVRDAMFQTYTSLRPSGQLQPDLQCAELEHQQSAPGPPSAQLPSGAGAAARGLARALDELPSEQEMAELAPADEEQGAARSPPTSSDGSTASGRDPGMQQAPSKGLSSDLGSNNLNSLSLDGSPTPQLRLGDQHRSGTSCQLDGSALREVESIPPASDQAVVARVEAMAHPDDLVDFFRQWQAELKASYQRAEACGFDDASVAAVECVTDRMTETWWHVGQLKPDYLCYLAHAVLPENSGQLPLWREIAHDSMQQLDEGSISILRRCWYNYSKRMAKIAIGVSRWVRRLQEITLSVDGGLVASANVAVELAEITKHMSAAVQEEYIASMEFVASQFPATSTFFKAWINVRSAPYLPDLVAIMFQIMQLDREQRQAHAAITAQPKPEPLQVQEG